jgi:hypothetical protein
VQARPEANEIILINSHDGASSYQMLAGNRRDSRSSSAGQPAGQSRSGCRW